MIFNKKYKTFFLDPYSEPMHIDEKVNIILSPSLYWVKKISLPVKYVRDALKLLPSIFEDILPDGNYSYSAYKCEETKGLNSDFFVFAYEDKRILDVMSDKNITMLNVVNVYFAQSELQNIEGAVKINERQSIYVKDELVILVPCCWVEEKGDLDLALLPLSKHKIILQQFGHIVDSRSLYTIGALMLVMILLVGIEYFITAEKSATITNLKDRLFVEHKLKETTFQNKSMLKKYQNIHKEQTEIRTYISYILSLKLKPQEKLIQVKFKNKTLIANFSGVDRENFRHITSSLNSKKIKFKTSYKNDILYVELAL